MKPRPLRPPGPPPLLQLRDVDAGPGEALRFEQLDLDIPPGLTAVVGDEGRGKTTLLRLLAGDLPPRRGHRTPVDAAWLDLRLPGDDALTPGQVWARQQAQHPRWNEALQRDLVDALQLAVHLDKRLEMLSSGSRRKVALVALLACGATLTCLDQPFPALDLASVRVLQDLLREAAGHAERAWVVADYEADPGLPWRQVVSLDPPSPLDSAA